MRRIYFLTGSWIFFVEEIHWNSSLTSSYSVQD